MIEAVLAPVDRAVRAVLALLLSVMVLCVTWQIVSRYVLGDPSPWTEELARFLLIWIGLIGGSFAYHRRLHLGVDLLGERLRGGRARRVHATSVHLLVALFAVAVLIVGGGELVRLTFELEQYSPALGVPMGVVYVSLPLSGLLLVLYAAAALASPGTPSGQGSAT